jgi:X-Pro dipeptidyl-peptidase
LSEWGRTVRSSGRDRDGPAARLDLSEGGIRLLDAESCWGASTAADDGCYRRTEEVLRRTDRAVLSRGLFDARHRRSLGREDFLTPGVDYVLRWSLAPQDVVVARGHRLAVVIAGSDPDVSLPEPTNSASVSVRLRGSSVTLPLVGGAAVLG